MNLIIRTSPVILAQKIWSYEKKLWEKWFYGKAFLARFKKITPKCDMCKGYILPSASYKTV